MRDLAVAYRIYPGISRSPAYHHEDKFKLSKMCLESFRRACDGLQVKVWALLDGCPPEYEALFRSIFTDEELEIISLQGEGNQATFLRQIDILTQQSDAEYVFFAEDDYFYFPGALGKMIDLARNNPDVDFVTPYDNSDSYCAPTAPARHFVKPYGKQYWRTASSTCLTFLTSKKNLQRTKRLFCTYSRGNWDCALWQSLTLKYELADLRVQWLNKFNFLRWVQTWRWGFIEILFGRRYKLWVPIPTLSTHMESTFLSPLVDWPSVFEESQQENLPS